ncbi:MAG: hypothetical protein Q8L69_05105, partial [Gallionellaceae bacterium]|nr:hypothetical protein [Gallionellaceae bacterium]
RNNDRQIEPKNLNSSHRVHREHRERKGSPQFCRLTRKVFRKFVATEYFSSVISVSSVAKQVLIDRTFRKPVQVG